MPPGSNGGHRQNFNDQDLPRLHVNVALSEDLTCFYKLSKMSSCTVEGGIQVQIQSNAQAPAFPFYLLIRDPLHHIESIQENKKFAAMINTAQDDDADHVFTVTVPKADNYFPVIRYKCNSELRPVPIVSHGGNIPKRIICLLLTLLMQTASSNTSTTRGTFLAGRPAD
jgi:hypothetical protein